jgi:phosphatidylserine/phosphatidylglycerophosphate/cardiolipin synthase-like enzyme
MPQVELRVICSTDDAFLVWRTQKLQECIGFCIERVWKQTAVAERTLDISEDLVNRVGFADDASAGPGQHQPSSVWPFQRYSLTDHDLTFGDIARYRVVPMLGRRGALTKDIADASIWVEVSASQPDHGRSNCFFNRPMAASQWMARKAAELKLKTSSDLVKAISKVDSNELRDFCGGSVIFALRNIFDHADATPSINLRAALFELKDQEIISRFCSLGARAHVVLGNGSAKPGLSDVNVAAREALKKAGCQVFDRLTSKAGDVGNLSHDKFIVIEDGGVPAWVWTGSTNLTPTGLFTQVNNAILINSSDLAQQYKDQWQRMADAGSDAPSTLKIVNHSPGTSITDPTPATPWFTPTVKQADLAELRKLIDAAKDGVLFLSFMPGDSGPILNVLEARTAGKYVRGVVNQFVGGATGKMKVELTGGRPSDPWLLDVFNPDGIKEQFAFWAQSFKRGGQIAVLIHSKVLCIDPLGDHPVVVTGSHNFSTLASESNDENFLVIEGDTEVARAYAAHVISVYQHYRWPEYVKDAEAKGEKPWQMLEDNPKWQDARLVSASQLQEWKFWMV